MAMLLPLLLLLPAPATCAPHRLTFNVNAGARLIRVEERAREFSETSPDGVGSQPQASISFAGDFHGAHPQLERASVSPVSRAVVEASLGQGKLAALAGGVDEPSTNAVVGAVGTSTVKATVAEDTGDTQHESVVAQPKKRGLQLHGPEDFPCHKIVHAADVPGKTQCSEQCPYWAESALKDQACQFKCVTKTECGVWGQGVAVKASVADKTGYCRRCQVPGCSMCHAHQDKCVECKNEYHLVDGKCVSDFSRIRYATYTVLSAVFIYLIAWYIELRCRPDVNQKGVDQGLEFRSLSKLRMPKGYQPPSTTGGTATSGAAGAAAAPGPAPGTTQPGPASETSRTQEAPEAGSTAGGTAEAGGAAGGAGAAGAGAGTGDGSADSGNTGSGAAGASAAAPRGSPSPDTSGATRPLWPLTTNLTKEPAGGPGNTLHFRFQLVWLVWAFFGFMLWAVMAAGHNKELFELGLKEAKTPRDLCRLVAWGYKLQRESMHVKVAYCALFYAGSVLGSLIFSILQLRQYQALDKYTTMKDFSAFVTGLPRLPGSAQVEKELADFLQTETGERIVGVSVCWDLTGKADAVRDLLEADIASRGQPGAPSGPGGAGGTTGTGGATGPAATAAGGASPEGAAQAAASPPPAPEGSEAGGAAAPPQPAASGAPPDRPLAPVEANGFRWKFFGAVDRTLLSVWGVPEAEVKQESGEKLATSLETTPYAFAVFESEKSRDTAIGKVAGKGGVTFKSSKLTLRGLEAEPESVRWDSMGMPISGLKLRFVRGVFVVIFALSMWALFFYLPYVAYQTTFQYDANHQAPSGGVYLILTFVVVGGNALMYFVCAAVTENMGFHFEEHREAAYVGFYCAAVMVNVALDMIVTGWISYQAMVGAGAHTFGGKFLSDLTSFEEIFESYPIQKTLGYQLYAYAYPSTFLIPFLAEPFLLIFVPYHLMKFVVRSNPFLVGWKAEKAMSIFVPMDTGRYADILVNVMLAVLILFVPGGWILPTFFALFMSHIYLYLYDQYRVLRCVPGFCYANAIVDKFAQKLVVIPCGVILACCLFKSNCMKGSYCVSGTKLAMLCVEAFLLHCVLHLLVLEYVVPKFGITESTRTDMSYAEAAKTTGATWFSVNPAYCLRSKFVYKHGPPCSLFVRGKEHLLAPNPTIGQHFQDEPALPEKY